MTFISEPTDSKTGHDALHVSEDELRSLFVVKHGRPEATGRNPRRRFSWGFFQPADHYEALVNKLVDTGTDWIDVGGGSDLFPDNRKLAEQLAGRARSLVGVDPSENIDSNSMLHEHAKCMIEEYHTERLFDLATLRMVAEHIEDPPSAVQALDRLLRPGGRVVIYTVNRWSPVTVISHVLPFRWHYPVKKLFWGGEEEDTFPTVYKMNSRRQLQVLFQQHGFEERYFHYLDDLSVLGRFRLLGYVELFVWRTLKLLGLRYPENCLLGVYEKKRDTNAL